MSRLSFLPFLLLSRAAIAGCFRAHPEAESDNMLLILSLFVLLGPVIGCAAGQWLRRSRGRKLQIGQLFRSFGSGVAATIGSGVLLLTIGPVAILAPVIGGTVACMVALTGLSDPDHESPKS